MATLKDLITWIKELFQSHNKLNPNSHNEGFNKEFKIYEEGLNNPPLRQDGSGPDEAKLHLFSNHGLNGQSGRIVFYSRIGNTTNPTLTDNTFVKKFCLDVDGNTDGDNYFTKCEFHFYDKDGGDVIGNRSGHLQLRFYYPQTSKGTTSNTRFEIWKWDNDQQAMVKLGANTFGPPDYTNEIKFVSGREVTYVATGPCWAVANAKDHDSEYNTECQVFIKAHGTTSWQKIMRQNPDYGTHGVATMIPLYKGDAIKVSAGRNNATGDGITGRGASIRVYKCVIN